MTNCKGPHTINAANVGSTRDLISQNVSSKYELDIVNGSFEIYVRWLFGWHYLSSLHSADEPQEGRNSCPLLRSYFISSCHVGVSKPFSRSISPAVHTVFEFKPRTGAQNYFSIPLKLAKKSDYRFPRPGTSDVIRCVSFDCFTSSQCISYNVSTHWAVFLAVLFCGKSSQMINYQVTHNLGLMLSRCN